MSKSRSAKKRQISQEPVELEITGLTHEGRGIARHQDKIVFVFGALPGEKVRAKYIYSHNRFDEATTVEVLQAAPERVTPPCAHFGVCGGCQLQHLDPTAQIHTKQKFLNEQLTFQAKVTPKHWLEPLVGDFQGYRQKARLAVRYVLKKNDLLVGFREQKNNKIAILESCQILDPKVGLKLVLLRNLIGSLDAREHIPQIEVAIGKNEAALVLRHLVPLETEDLAKLQHFAEQQNFSLYLQPGNYESVHKIWPENTADTLIYELPDQGLTYHFHPNDFTQVNQGMNQKMINLALDLIQPSPNDIFLDLFCGLGNFSLPMAQKAHYVVGVEGTAAMAQRAKHNAHFNNLENCEFHAADLESDFSTSQWAQKEYTKIILDPPRSGALKVVEQIKQFKAKEILYISCNSATFTRDAAILVHQHGFQLEKVGVMDMFSHTAHVETIGLFKK